VTFISIHSVIIYVVFFGACMRCTRLCSLKPGVTSSWTTTPPSPSPSPPNFPRSCPSTAHTLTITNVYAPSDHRTPPRSLMSSRTFLDLSTTHGSSVISTLCVASMTFAQGESIPYSTNFSTTPLMPWVSKNSLYIGARSLGPMVSLTQPLPA
jgi:hypothetical protein